MSSEHVAHLQRMANESWIGSPERAALDAAIAVLSAPQPPAEAQAQGGGEVFGWVLGDAFVDARFWTAGTPPWGWTPVYRTAPPSAPVGVEGLLADLETIWHSVSDDKETNAAYERLKIALAQQPAADGGFTAADMMDARQEGRKEAQQPAAVDEAMVARFLEAYRDTPGDEAIDADEKVARRWLTAALAAQQGDSHE